MKAIEMVKKALAEVGITEYPPDSNNVKYNTWYYGREVSGASYPWCCAFISWLFKSDRDLLMRTASCQELLTWFEHNGSVVKKPEVGDIVFYKFAGNSRRTNHVGIVVGVNGAQISAVEGNTSIGNDSNGGQVLQRSRKSNIVAFARPCYDDAWIEVEKGSKGVFVAKLQAILKAKYGKRIEVDGDMGDATVQALIEVQALLHDSTGKPLVKDGIAGEKTWKALM